MEFRGDFLTQAVLKSIVVDGVGAKDRFWSRLVKKVVDKYIFVPPLMMSESAIKRRYERRS
jgi:hypothetical protein